MWKEATDPINFVCGRNFLACSGFFLLDGMGLLTGFFSRSTTRCLINNATLLFGDA